jgi:hypothetical protein
MDPTQNPAPQPAADPFAAITQEQLPTAPPTETPPAEPPVQAPPTETPPVEAPPVETPPTETPPTETPPVEPPAPAEQYQSYEEYLDSVLGKAKEDPQPPNPAEINPDDPEAIKAFFDNLLTTAEQRIEAKIARKEAIQRAEKKVWDEAFAKYPTLKSNQNVRDMVHNIRMGYFQRGEAITPLQAAEKLLSSLNSSYKQGIVDNQVVTKIEEVQPQGGGTITPPTTGADKDTVLKAVQDGGEDALRDFLNTEIQNNRL